MKTIITPLGFETTPIVSFIAKDGIEKGDKVIVIRPKESPDEKRGGRAYNESKKLLQSISSDIKMEKVVLDTKDFEGMILKISKIINDIEGEIVVNLSGGVRSILVALTSASVFYNQKIDRFYNHDIIENTMKQVNIPYVHTDLTENEMNLLKTVVKEGPIFYNELVEILDISKSTVSRLSNLLQNKNLLKIDEKYKQMEVSASLTGKLVVDTI